MDTDNKKANKKKFRRDAVTIICYVIALIFLFYIFYRAGKMFALINSYFAGFGVKPELRDYVVYTIPELIAPFRNGALIFMFGYILDAIRKNNPDNYATEEELVEARIAKKEAREAKKFARGEAAAAKAGAEKVVKEAAVEADFAAETEATEVIEDLEATVKDTDISK